jgi:hypothetical protein
VKPRLFALVVSLVAYSLAQSALGGPPNNVGNVDLSYRITLDVLNPNASAEDINSCARDQNWYKCPIVYFKGPRHCPETRVVFTNWTTNGTKVVKLSSTMTTVMSNVHGSSFVPIRTCDYHAQAIDVGSFENTLAAYWGCTSNIVDPYAVSLWTEDFYVNNHAWNWWSAQAIDFQAAQPIVTRFSLEVCTLGN